MKTKERKQYTAEFKAQAIALMATGKPVAQLAEELCMSSNLLYNWRANSKEAQGGSAGARAVGEGSDADALRLLRREVALLKEENLILKKAAVILGTRILPNFAQ
jgi:transposase